MDAGYAARYSTVDKECLKKDFSRERAPVVVNTEFSGLTLLGRKPYAGAYRAGEVVWNYASWWSSGVRSYWDPAKTSEEDVEKENNRSRYRALVQRLKAVASSLLPFQKVMLVQCVTSRLIAYALKGDGGESSYSVQCTIDTGRGQCREFSGLAVDLLGEVGMSASLYANVTHTETKDGTVKKSGGHVVAKVDIGEESFLIEPQNTIFRLYQERFNARARKGEVLAWFEPPPETFDPNSLLRSNSTQPATAPSQSENTKKAPSSRPAEPSTNPVTTAPSAR